MSRGTHLPKVPVARGERYDKNIMSHFPKIFLRPMMCITKYRFAHKRAAIQYCYISVINTEEFVNNISIINAF